MFDGFGSHFAVFGCLDVIVVDAFIREFEVLKEETVWTSEGAHAGDGDGLSFKLMYVMTATKIKKISLKLLFD